nr:hypothetical protein [Ruegeria marina]
MCLYGAHGFGTCQPFQNRANNQRSDEYGGSLANRARFSREVIADIRDAVGDTMAITLRVSLDESIGDLGFSNVELRDYIELNRNLPDLWDLAQGMWEGCPGPSRFKNETAREQLVRGIRELTDVIVRMVKSGTLDFIGCNICIATGATWRRDGVCWPCPSPPARVFAPDDLMEGRLPGGRVVIFDDDHCYLGGALAELLVKSGADVTLVNPAPCVSDGTRNTLEQGAFMSGWPRRAWRSC